MGRAKVNCWSIRTRKTKGFTLIELLVVLVVMGLMGRRR